jgi:hypothetical protein
MHRKRRIGRKFKSMRPVDDRKLRNGRKFETEAFEAEQSQQRPQEARVGCDPRRSIISYGARMVDIGRPFMLLLLAKPVALPFVAARIVGICWLTAAE